MGKPGETGGKHGKKPGETGGTYGKNMKSSRNRCKLGYQHHFLQFWSFSSGIPIGVQPGTGCTPLSDQIYPNMVDKALFFKCLSFTISF